MSNNKLSELIKIIEEKSNVSDIISDYISLEKKGNNHVGLCPFHSDSNPSMSVSDQKHIFKCFVCGAAGGAITFVKNYKGISYIDAVKEVADKLKIDWRPYITQRQRVIKPEIKRGWEINEEALNFFKYNLSNTKNQNIISYVESRGLTKDINDKFDIGYSQEGLSNFLLNKDFTEEEIIKYGLAKRREDTTLQDYFINRLIFTIRDYDGNIIGFSGRVMDSNSKYVKYMNSPETPLFKKSNVLYNVHNSKISGNLKSELIVVEGFMDVIALSKVGIENSIATMGTAFTNQHNKIISKITKNIVLAFDSDAAGINASISTGKTLLSDGLNVDVVSIPSGKDFDELLKLGKDEVTKTLSNKKSFVNFYKTLIYKKLDSQGDNVSFDILKGLMEILVMNGDKFISSNIINETSEKYKIDKNILEDEYNSKLTETSNHKQNVQNQPQPPFVPEFIPHVQSTDEVRLQKFTSQISKTDERHNTKIQLTMKEETIVSCAIMYDFAYEYLKSKKFFIRNEETRKLWNAYLNSKENDIPIQDEIVNARIEALKSKTIESMNKFSFVEIHDQDTYANFIEGYNHILKEFDKLNLMNELNNSTEWEEKEHILKMLKKIS